MTPRQRAANTLREVEEKRGNARVRELGYYAAQASMFESEFEQLLATSPQLTDQTYAALTDPKSAAQRTAVIDGLLATHRTSRKATALLQSARDQQK